MYERPSASRTRSPRPDRTKKGSPPTEANERTGEDTPPGIKRRARRKRAEDRTDFGTFEGVAILENRPLLREPSRRGSGVVGEHEVGAGADDPGEDLEDDPTLLDPAF